jgi:DNA repair exonuclease SbcCD ATPase subunit
MTVTLRNLLGELFAYFTVCEDELNSTLIGELVRVEPDELKNSAELSKNISEVNGQTFSFASENTCNKCGVNAEAKSNSSSIKNGEMSLESTITSPPENDIPVVQDCVTCDEVSMASHHLDQSLVPIRQRGSSAANVTHRVHFASDASCFISLIDEENLLDYIERNKDLSMNFRSELDNCLERLKAEALAILGLSGSLPKTVQSTRDAVVFLEEKVNILTNQLAMEVKEKDKLLMQLENYQRKERECAVLQDQLESLETMREGLESDLKAARTRVTELESELGKKEDVTEGFGESIQPGLVWRLHSMAELQDKGG